MWAISLFILLGFSAISVLSCPGGTTNPVIRAPSPNSNNEPKRLIQLSEDEPAQWLDPYQIEGLINVHANFIDITNHTSLPINVKSDDVIPISTNSQATVVPILQLLSTSNMQNFIQNFSNFRTRFYIGPSGVRSQRWLLKQAEQVAAGYPRGAVVKEFSHWWGSQNSVIARIEGSDPTLKDQVVIIGAHQDSINKYFPGFTAPGADDNASGSAIVLEALRVIVASGFVPRRTIEFHWYAAEEVGLRGSGAVAKAYSKAGINVVSMLNFDVAGYNKGGSKQIGIYTDKTSPKLNSFLRVLTENYCDWSWSDQKCGYGCSDHASWTRYGFPASMAAEVVLNPFMHTPSDNFAAVDFNQVLELSKLGTAYIVEMSG